MPITILSIVFLLASALAVFFAVYSLIPAEEGALSGAGDLGLEGVEAEQISPVVSALRPVFTLLTPAVRWIKADRYRTWIERKFVTAGMAGSLTTDEFFGYKIIMSVAFWGLFVGLFARVVVGWDPSIGATIVVLIIGSFFPDAWLTGQVQERQDKILKSLPYVLDLLTLSVEAGLDFVSGIHKVCEKSVQGPLVDELSFFLGELQVGATRQQALRNLALRVDMKEMRSFAAMLIQADVLGASVGPILRAQSDLMRTARFQRAEREGAYAAQKILFPLIFCIMPAVFIVIFGPIALNFFYGDQTIGI